MATGNDPGVAGAGVGGARDSARAGGTGVSDETIHAIKSSEFWIFLALVVGLIIASLVGGFGPDRVWFFLTLLTVGYLVSRGIAKALGGGRGKSSFKTTELWVFAAALIALFITGLVTRGEGHGELACAYLQPASLCDTLDADRVWYYATILGIGYLISRGLAKSGAGARASAAGK